MPGGAWNLRRLNLSWYFQPSYPRICCAFYSYQKSWKFQGARHLSLNSYKRANIDVINAKSLETSPGRIDRHSSSEFIQMRRAKKKAQKSLTQEQIMSAASAETRWNQLIYCRVPTGDTSGDKSWQANKRPDNKYSTALLNRNSNRTKYRRRGERIKINLSCCLSLDTACRGCDHSILK